MRLSPLHSSPRHPVRYEYAASLAPRAFIIVRLPRPRLAHPRAPWVTVWAAGTAAARGVAILLVRCRRCPAHLMGQRRSLPRCPVRSLRGLRPERCLLAHGLAAHPRCALLARCCNHRMGVLRRRRRRRRLVCSALAAERFANKRCAVGGSVSGGSIHRRPPPRRHPHAAAAACPVTLALVAQRLARSRLSFWLHRCGRLPPPVREPRSARRAPRGLTTTAPCQPLLARLPRWSPGLPPSRANSHSCRPPRGSCSPRHPPAHWSRRRRRGRRGPALKGPPALTTGSALEGGGGSRPLSGRATCDLP